MLYTQRVFWPNISDAARRRRVLGFLARHRAICQEISFFTEGDGSDWRWLEPAEIERRAPIMAEAVAEARALGFAVAVNILNTMGHGGDPAQPAPAWRQPMIGHDGSASIVTACPQSADFLAYVRLKYRAFAGSGAGRYWIDDDIRMTHHHPVQRGCYCATCLASMAKRLGRPLDRPSLAAAVEGDPAVHAAWIAHEDTLLGGVLDAAVDGIRAVDANAEIGLMSAFPRDHRDLLARLGRGGARAWIRPGGFVWTDHEPRAVLSKQISVAAQAEGLPATVGRTYEVENYPYTVGTKSAAFTGLECLLATVSGPRDGIMFNVLDGFGNDPAIQERWLSALEAWIPRLDAAAGAVAGTSASGWRAVGGPHLLHLSHHQLGQLQLAGLPLAGDEAGMRGQVLTAGMAARLSREEWEALLAHPLLLDGDAAARAVALGLGARLGLRGGSAYRDATHEVFFDHPINAGFAGFRRAFTVYDQDRHAFDPLPGTTVLSRLVSTEGRDLGAALTLHTPPAGAPVAVLGNAPWTHVLSAARMSQLVRLSEAMLPAMPVTVRTDQAFAWWSRHGAGKDLVVIANPGFDPLEAACGHRRGSAVELVFAMPGVASEEDATGGCRVTLPPWSVAVLAWKAG